MPLPRSLRRAIHGCLFALPMGTALVRPALAEEEPKALARQHYARGVALANAGDYDQALAEFTRAYELVPHYAVLYNVGQAYLELGRTVKAVESLEQYLRLGAASIPPERRRQVEAELATLSAELAAIQVTVDEEGAQISVDGEPVGRAPLSSSVRLSAGRHTLVAVSASGRRVEQMLELSRGETRPIALRFREPETNPAVFGFVTVNCATAGLSLAVDGRAVAVTPLSRPLPLPPGAHRLSFSGPLHPARAIDVQLEGSEQISVNCSGAAPRRPAPGPAARSRTQRSFGYALGAVGLGLGGAAVAHWRWNDGRYEDWQSDYAAYGRNPAPAQSELDAINAQAESVERASVVTVSLGIAAALSLGAGVVLLVTEGGDADRAASGRAWNRATSHCKAPLVGFCSRW
jgi:hypothetical protein